MDIQNLTGIAEMLLELGFPVSTGRRIIYNACFRQKHFAITEHISYGEDTTNYQLFFEKDSQTEKLRFSHYDATLKRVIAIPAAVINGINVLELEKKMNVISWRMTLNNYDSGDFTITDKSTWKQEAEIEEVVKKLEVLEATEEGLTLSNALKYKFWTEPALQGLISDLYSLKGKYELTQRFYIINGRGITAAEAYRFLNNRWMERQIHATNRAVRKNAGEQTSGKFINKGIINKRKSKQLVNKISEK